MIDMEWQMLVQYILIFTLGCWIIEFYFQIRGLRRNKWWLEQAVEDEIGKNEELSELHQKACDRNIKLLGEGIRLTENEIQSGLSRVTSAENLIRELPKVHGGRNTWLLNYGMGYEASEIRKNWSSDALASHPFALDEATQSWA